MRFFKTLYVQVLIAILLGILIGYLYPAIATSLKPIADGFIKLIRMLIAPIIFCTIVTGMAGMQNTKKVGRVGIKSLVYFEIVTTIALLTGMLVINILRPGEGMHINAATIGPESSATPMQAVVPKSGPDFLLDIIPESVLSAFVGNNLLQVLFFSILMGFALSKLGARGAGLTGSIQVLESALFKVIGWIMKLAPIGAFAAMAFTIGKYGIASIVSLGELMLSFYSTCILFIIIVLGGILKLVGFNIFRLIAYLRDELLVVLGTSSSESALPNLIDKLKKVGVSEPVVGLVVPTGYSFNLDGTSIYLTMAAIFLAQATDTPMDFSQQFTLLLVLLLTSKGAAGVTGSGFITLAATLPAVGHIPIGALALIVGIDRFMSEGRALTNIIGNAVATVVIGKWEKEIDMNEARRLIG